MKLRTRTISRRRTEVIVEHFQAVNAATRSAAGPRRWWSPDHVWKRCGYKQSFDRYIHKKGYDIKSLVAFSGTVVDDKLPDVNYTEPGMNQGSLRERAAGRSSPRKNIRSC